MAALSQLGVLAASVWLCSISLSFGSGTRFCYTGESCRDVCQNYLHGQDCTKMYKFCSCSVRECRYFNGSCIYTCLGEKAGRTIRDGESEVESKCNNTCLDACYSESLCNNTMCSECVPGYYGTNCSDKCSSLCTQSCDRHTGICNECAPGFYGARCTLRCPKNCIGAACSRSSGECRQCQPGFIGERCSIKCSQGYYGVECRNTCNNGCKHSSCDHVTGRCLQGCNPGYFGKFCDILCPNGTYGSDCLSQCPATCLSGTGCHHVTGECTGGCIAGFMGGVCDQVCPEGRHSESCGQNCSDFCFLRLCNPFSGRCQACVRGRSGPLCDVTTEYQTYKHQTVIDAEMTPNKVLGVVFGLLFLGMSLWCITGASAYYRNMRSLDKVYKTGKLPKRWKRRAPHIRGKFVVASRWRKPRRRRRRRAAELSNAWIEKKLKRGQFSERLKEHFSLLGSRKDRKFAPTARASDEESTAGDRAKLPDFPSKLSLRPASVGIHESCGRPLELCSCHSGITINAEGKSLRKDVTEISTTTDSDEDSEEATEDIGVTTTSETTFVPLETSYVSNALPQSKRLELTSDLTAPEGEPGTSHDSTGGKTTSSGPTCKVKLRRTTSRVRTKSQHRLRDSGQHDVSTTTDTAEDSTEEAIEDMEATSAASDSESPTNSRVEYEDESTTSILGRKRGKLSRRYGRKHRGDLKHLHKADGLDDTEKAPDVEKNLHPSGISVSKTEKKEDEDGARRAKAKQAPPVKPVSKADRKVHVEDKAVHTDPAPPSIFPRGLRNVADLFGRLTGNRRQAPTTQAATQPSGLQQQPSSPSQRPMNQRFLLARLDDWFTTQRPGYVHRGPPIGV